VCRRAGGEKGLLAGVWSLVALAVPFSCGSTAARPGASLARREPVGIGLADDRVVMHRVFEHPYQILGVAAPRKP